MLAPAARWMDVGRCGNSIPRYASGTSLSRCPAVKASRAASWETLSTSFKPTVTRPTDEGAVFTSVTAAIFNLDDNDENVYSQIEPVLAVSTSTSATTKFSIDVLDAPGPDLDHVATSCQLFPDFQRLLPGSEDDLELSDYSEDEEFVYIPTMTSHAFEDPEETEVFDKSADDKLLQNAFKTPGNIVVDCVNPEKAPHIVITPAESTPYDDYIAWGNRVDFQWRGWLCVPPTYISRTSLPSIALDAQADILGPAPDVDPLIAFKAKKVFSLAKFTRVVEAAATERLIMYHIVTALQRHLVKAVAYVAAAQALLLSHPLSPINDPYEYQWTDPAIPLLQAHSHTLGTLVLDSIKPFRAPHIVITFAPPENPWIAWDNRIGVQYPGWLAVPGIPFMGYWDDEDSLSDDHSVMEVPSEGDDDVDFLQAAFDQEVDRDEESEPETTPPGTPEQETPVRLETIKEEEEDIWGDEDEDELPPFDDWYQQIAQRNGVQVQ
ncbi:uncharacterized protein EV420DRAFT_131813 [Desarmillaria tabescens]|uniref:Uncharacterized protein n=1 Tax=Armillaria tabescens TaxID=1929756 RepID=A0AA39NA26_ARMTA|nr:uncharacterized protein EV420DRAFT_131813 [Desarmillaria tabescens]KAK0461830.1 hypothetical protein EV420DRAFT_131813 [Desarmillaria tabescens]